jgi:hypothetical protein
VNPGRGRLAGIAERRIFKSYASLSSVPTDELKALADILKDHSSIPGQNHAGVVGPVVMAELARRNGADCQRRPHPDGSGH